MECNVPNISVECEVAPSKYKTSETTSLDASIPFTVICWAWRAYKISNARMGFPWLVPKLIHMFSHFVPTKCSCILSPLKCCQSGWESNPQPCFPQQSCTHRATTSAKCFWILLPMAYSHRIQEWIPQAQSLACRRSVQQIQNRTKMSCSTQNMNSLFTSRRQICRNSTDICHWKQGFLLRDSILKKKGSIIQGSKKFIIASTIDSIKPDSSHILHVGTNVDNFYIHITVTTHFRQVQ